MVTAADEVVAELQRQQRHAEQCEHELLRARKATAAGEHRLALLIRVIHEFARRAPAATTTVGHPDRGHFHSAGARGRDG